MGATMEHDPILQRLVLVAAGVKGVAAIVLGGSRARGTAYAESDYDIGLYYSAAQPLDTGELLQAVKTVVDEPAAAELTPVGRWGPWIVGGGWLSIKGRKVDLLYRNLEAVARVIDACRVGEIGMHYQPGHPHGFCSAIWMGEAALGVPLHDPFGNFARLKARTTPYPRALRQALIRKFQWEVSFSIENAELAAARGEQTHVAGCVYRALSCIAQVLFAMNERYLINEKGALQEAATLPLTIASLSGRVADLWRLIGEKKLTLALSSLRDIEQELIAITGLPRGS